MKLALLYCDGCPNWERTWRLLETLGGEFGLLVERRRVDTPEDAQRLAFRGSPTVLIDGRDPFASGGAVGLSCRIYLTATGLAGAPTEQQLRDVLAASPDGEVSCGRASSTPSPPGLSGPPSSIRGRM